MKALFCLLLILVQAVACLRFIEIELQDARASNARFERLRELDQRLEYMVWPQERARLIEAMRNLVDTQMQQEPFSPSLHQHRVALELMSIAADIDSQNRLRVSLDYLNAVRPNFPRISKFLHDICGHEQALFVQDWYQTRGLKQ